MLKEKINLFVAGSEFVFEGKSFTIEKNEIKLEKAVISTDKRTFVFYENELDEFIEKITFIEKVPAIQGVSQELPVVKVDNVNLAIKAEIITSNQRANRISEKLEAMFDKLTDNPSDETLKQAKAMQDLSNSIVNVEMMKFKLLTAK